MKRGALSITLLAAALAATGVLVWGALPGETAIRENPPAPPGPVDLAASFAPTWPLHNETMGGCEICHYAWKVPFDLTATRTATLGPEAAYTVVLQPTSGYELPLVAAAPIAPGAAPPEPTVAERVVDVPAPTYVASETFDVKGAGLILAEAWSTDAYQRPDISLSLVVPASGAAPTGSPGIEGIGAHSSKHAFWHDAIGGGHTGPVTVSVSVADATRFPQQVSLRLTTLPVGYRLVENATRGAPANLSWILPGPEAEGAPGAFHFFTVAFNDHPVDKWRLPVENDRAHYFGLIEANGTAPEPAAPEWTDAEIEEIWSGRESIPLYEERFDGPRVYHLNERGEWTRTGVPVSAEVPEESPFPAIPPGTTYVKATLTWEKRSLVHPDPRWTFSYTRSPVPDFVYPDPWSLKVGERVDIVPIEPRHWETGPTGWFQGFYLLAVDENGNALYDGSHHFTLEAMRGPVPAPEGLG